MLSASLTSNAAKLLKYANIDDFERPWNPKRVLVILGNIRLRRIY